MITSIAQTITILLFLSLPPPLQGVVTYLTANKGMVVAEGQAAVDSSIAHYNTLKEEVAAAAEAGEDLCPY